MKCVPHKPRKFSQFHKVFVCNIVTSIALHIIQLLLGKHEKYTSKYENTSTAKSSGINIVLQHITTMNICVI
jgi:cell division protein FtsL